MERRIRIGNLKVDIARHEVFCGPARVYLTFTEFRLLKFLCENRGFVFTREVLLAKVWGDGFHGTTRTVDVYVRRLRSKLGPPGADLIETVRSIGYKCADGAGIGQRVS